MSRFTTDRLPPYEALRRLLDVLREQRPDVGFDTTRDGRSGEVRIVFRRDGREYAVEADSDVGVNDTADRILAIVAKELPPNTRLPESPAGARRFSVAMTERGECWPDTSVSVDVWLAGSRWRAQTEHRCAVVESDLHGVVVFLAAAAYLGWVDGVRLPEVVEWREREVDPDNTET